MVPFQPPCMQPLGNGTVYADWMVWLPRRALHGAFEAPSADFAQCRVRFGEGVMAGMSPEQYLVAAAKLHGVWMVSADSAATSMPAFAIVRPQGKASPPGGFVCTKLAASLHHSAAATLQTNASFVTPGGFNALYYRGKGMEAALARAEAPTCTRLLVSNPCNVHLNAAAAREKRSVPNGTRAHQC